MASLKLIADEISDALARPFDDMFKERIKSIFRHELATVIRQQINKYGLSNQFKSNFQVTCIESSPVVTSLYSIDTTDNWYRSENKIPTPIRYESDDPFTFVGNILDNIPFISNPMSKNEILSSFMSYLKQTANNNKKYHTTFKEPEISEKPIINSVTLLSKIKILFNGLIK